MKNLIKKLLRSKFFISFAFLIILMFPTTIYKQADNHTRLVATTIGIDKTEDGYEITTLAVIPKASTDVNANLEIFSAKGKSVSEALNNIALDTGKNVGLAHCDCIILSKDVLNDNVAKILDYFIRTANLTTNSTILATNQKSKDLVEATKSSNNLLDLSLKDIVSFQEERTLLENTTIEKFYKKYFSKSSTFILPIISVEETSGGESDTSGQTSGNNDQSSGGGAGGSSSQQKKIKNESKVALIQNGSFVRELTEDELFIYNLLTGGSKYMSITIEDINDEYVTKSTEIYQQIDKIGFPIYKFEDGKPVVEYQIWLNVMLDEIISEDNFAYASIDALQNFLSTTAEKEIRNQIQTKLESTVDTMHTEKNDILGLYSAFNAFTHKKFLNYLNTLDNQEDYLKNIDIKINLHLNYVI